MGILSAIINSLKKEEKLKKTNVNNSKGLYTPYDSLKINEFISKYDLSTKEGIKSIPISEATKYPDVLNVSVVYMPEQILNRKATEYKKEKRYDLAIECLKKANELLEYSPFSYMRTDYERLVDMLVLAGQYEEAKIEHKKLNEKYGTRLDELHALQNISAQMDCESIENYQKRVIDPYMSEELDREHYYWLLENKPNIAPKSFNSYRRMKNQNTDNYQKIIKQLEAEGYTINKIKFWE